MGVHVDSVVVGGVLLPLKELDGCLIELQNDNLVENVQTLDVFVKLRDGVRQLRDLANLPLLTLEEGKESVLALLHLEEVFFVLVSLLLLDNLALLHLVFLDDGLVDCFKIEDLKLQPPFHDQPSKP